MPHRRWLAAAVAGGASLALAGTAAADSLVYLKDGNVWVANPDGSGARPITTKGTANNSYQYPTQADDGTIMAKRDGFERFDRAGNPLRAPLAMASPPGIGIYGMLMNDLDLSPDGSKALYGYIGTACDSLGCYGQRYGVMFTHADRYTPASEFGAQRSPIRGVWMSNSQALLFPYMYPVDVPGDEVLDGFGGAWVPGGATEGDITRAGDKLAISLAGDTIKIYQTTGPYPAPPQGRCEVTGPNGSFRELSWSPDGTALAWQENDGIWTVPVPDLNCGQQAKLVIPGGAAPDWGSVGPEKPPPPPAKPTPTPTATPVPTATPQPGPAARLTRLRVKVTKQRKAVIAYRLSASTRVTFKLERCATRKCNRARLATRITHNGRRGHNRVTYRKRLKPGTYRLTAFTGTTVTFTVRR